MAGVLGLLSGVATGLVIGYVAARPMVGLADGLAVGSASGLAAGFASRLREAWSVDRPSRLLHHDLVCELTVSRWPRYWVAVAIACGRGVLPARPAAFLDGTYTAGLVRLSGYAVQFRHREGVAPLPAIPARVPEPPATGPARYRKR